jgi:hypothetical protein
MPQVAMFRGGGSALGRPLSAAANRRKKIGTNFTLFLERLVVALGPQSLRP